MAHGNTGHIAKCDGLASACGRTSAVAIAAAFLALFAAAWTTGSSDWLKVMAVAAFFLAVNGIMAMIAPRLGGGMSCSTTERRDAR